MSEINANRAPVRLTVTGILEDLANGLTRPEIRSKYSLSASDMTSLFQHPKLKGRKPAKVAGFILEDDTLMSSEEEIVMEENVTPREEVTREAEEFNTTVDTSTVNVSNQSLY